MNVEIGTEAVQFLSCEYINPNFCAVYNRGPQPLCTTTFFLRAKSWDTARNPHEQQYRVQVCYLVAKGKQQCKKRLGKFDNLFLQWITKVV